MDKISSPIKARLLQYIEYKGITRDVFCKNTGISASNFKGVGLKSELGGDKVVRILTCYADLSSDWLLTGCGEMLRSGNAAAYPAAGEESGCLSDASGSYNAVSAGVEMRAVPLYELDAGAGLAALFAHAGQPVAQLALPGLPPCDGALYVRGDSMYPLLKSGDIVLYKEVGDISRGILWGEMYLVSFEVDGEAYISIRYIQRGADDRHVRLVSHNAHHSPQDIPLASIRALALIKASVRYNTMG